MKLLHRIQMNTTENAAPPYEMVRDGEVWLVGAGPGHPGLLTILGRQILNQAEVVVHDRLGCEEILHELPQEIRRIDVGKIAGGGGSSQDAINRTLEKEARGGYRVVRLKGGDPFVFGRGFEELQYLCERGIPCRVVAGVSSAVAGPLWAGIPPTHRDLARGFSIQTARQRGGTVPESAGGDTRIFLMAMGVLGTVAEQLMSTGFSPETPAAVITNATTYRQRSVVSTIGRIESAAREAGLEPPGILIVGKTVALAQAASPSAKTILVPSARIPELARDRFPEARMLWRPLVGYAPLRGSALRASVAGLPTLIQSDWILFNSRQSVSHFFGILADSGLDVRRFRGSIACIGVETTAELARFALRPDVVAVDGDRDGLADQLMGVLCGKSVLLPTSLDYQGALGESLGARGAIVHPLAVYTRETRQPAPVDWDFISGVLFSSPALVRIFCTAYPDAPIHRLDAHCIGTTTHNRAREAGFLHAGEITRMPQAPPLDLTAEAIRTA